MKKSLEKEIKNLIKIYKLNCTIKDFSRKVDWINISRCQKLSEDFIREFKDKVDWINISCYQKLSEDFIREFKDKVSWFNISSYQKLSEDFIREFKDKVDWGVLPNATKIKALIKSEEQRKEQEERETLEKCRLLRQKECSQNSVLSLEI